MKSQDLKKNKKQHFYAMTSSLISQTKSQRHRMTFVVYKIESNYHDFIHGCIMNEGKPFAFGWIPAALSFPNKTENNYTGFKFHIGLNWYGIRQIVTFFPLLSLGLIYFTVSCATISSCNKKGKGRRNPISNFISKS